MSQRRIRIRAAAKRDLAERYARFVREVGEDVAERFLAQAEAAFLSLAETPGMGAETGLKGPRTKPLRKWKIGGFPDLRIFYLPTRGGVSIVRVLHAAQDVSSILTPG